MIKNIKKTMYWLLSLAIASAMAFSSFNLLAYAASAGTQMVDLYANNAVESAIIDDTEYTFRMYYDDDGNKAIDIINNSNGSVDVLIYDAEESVLYLNDNEFGTVTDLPTESHKVPPATGDSYQFQPYLDPYMWKYVWKFTASTGSTYGPYNSYTQVN